MSGRYGSPTARNLGLSEEELIGKVFAHCQQLGDHVPQVWTLAASSWPPSCPFTFLFFPLLYRLLWVELFLINLKEYVGIVHHFCP